VNGRPIQLLVVPFDVERRDTAMARGPAGLLAHRFQERLRKAGWDVKILQARIPEKTSKLAMVTAVGQWIAGAVEAVISFEHFPLILSGGCLASMGVLSGLQGSGVDPASVWIDAHGDFNTEETSPSGYWDGMALASVCGLSLPEVREGIGLRPLGMDRVVHLAGRSFDPLEIENVRTRGLAAIPPDRIAAPESLEILGKLNGPLYLHVDVDGLDPGDAPAAGFPEPGGPRLEDVLRCLSALPPPAALTFSALSFDRVTEEEAARTVETCARLVGTP
jgi:arginase